VALCFGAPHVIRAVHDKIVNPLVKFPNIIHPNFQIADEKTFVIGEGNIIARDCAVTCNITIGSFNLFNGDVTFGHDVTTGDYNVFMPRAQVSGEVTIGNENLLGTSCFIKQQITIKDNTTIGAMSAVLTKPKSGCTYIGNPAKIFKF
jgi:acetyltransferase-like isoleucine patch superfamily enzyme